MPEVEEEEGLGFRQKGNRAPPPGKGEAFYTIGYSIKHCDRRNYSTNPNLLIYIRLLTIDGEIRRIDPLTLTREYSDTSNFAGERILGLY